MRFLAINTVGASVEVALYSDGKIVHRYDAEFKKASSVLFPFIDALLNESGITLKDLDFIAAVSGPGSFTGIRIGISAARAFAQFTDLPMVTVTYAEVLSYNYNSTQKKVKQSANTIGTEFSPNKSMVESIVTLSDAANGYCYVAAFDEQRNVLLKPAAMPIGQVGKFLDSIDEPCAVCTDEAMQRQVFASGKKIEPLVIDGSSLISAVIAAHKRYGTIPYGQAIPLYVRQSQAEADLK